MNVLQHLYWDLTSYSFFHALLRFLYGAKLPYGETRHLMSDYYPNIINWENRITLKVLHKKYIDVVVLRLFGSSRIFDRNNFWNLSNQINQLYLFCNRICRFSIEVNQIGLIRFTIQLWLFVHCNFHYGCVRHEAFESF